MTHRKPPTPPWFNDISPGRCRWCNGHIPPTKTGRPSKATWHKSCVEEYMTVMYQSHARKAVWKRDKGVCKKCGAVCQRRNNSWHMDHIVPLIEAQGDLTYWKLPNLQTLCVPCHKEKTAREATERARKRKG